MLKCRMFDNLLLPPPHVDKALNEHIIKMPEQENGVSIENFVAHTNY